MPTDTFFPSLSTLVLFKMHFFPLSLYAAIVTFPPAPFGGRLGVVHKSHIKWATKTHFGLIRMNCSWMPGTFPFPSSLSCAWWSFPSDQNVGRGGENVREIPLQVRPSALAGANCTQQKDWFVKCILLASRTNICANHIIVCGEIGNTWRYSSFYKYPIIYEIKLNSTW